MAADKQCAEFQLEEPGILMRVDYEKIPALIARLREVELEYRSRTLRSRIEEVVAGTPVTIAYAVDWLDADSRMVGVGLNIPGFTSPVRCQLYPDDAIEWVRRWVEKKEV